MSIFNFLLKFLRQLILRSQIFIILFCFCAHSSTKEDFWRTIVYETAGERIGHAHWALVSHSPTLAEKMFHLRKNILHAGEPPAVQECSRLTGIPVKNITDDEKEIEHLTAPFDSPEHMSARTLSLFFLLQNRPSLISILTTHSLSSLFDRLEDHHPFVWGGVVLLQASNFPNLPENFRVMNFGSCLSNWVGKALGRITGKAQKTVFSVKACRTDFYIDTYLKHTNSLDYEKDLRSIDLGSWELKAQINEQTLGYFGIERPDLFIPVPGRPVFGENFFKEDLDFIIFDSFADVVFKLARFLKDPTKRLFCTPTMVTNFDQHFSLESDYLAPEESAKNFLELIKQFQAWKPSAKVVFIHFPFEFCTPAAQHRSKNLIKAFKDLNSTFPVFEVMVGGDDSTDCCYHFKPHIYERTARMILEECYKA